MKKLKNFILIIFILFINVIQSQEYKHLESGKQINGDHAYTLPKTAIIFEVPIVTTILIPGDSIKKYTEEQLKILEKKYGVDPKKYENAISKKFLTSHTIADDSIKVSFTPVADYTKIFYVDPKKKWNKNQITSIIYGNDGILLEGESSLENKTFDLIVKGISGLTSIVGSFYKSSGNIKNKDITEITALDEALARYKRLENLNNFDIYKDLKINYDKNYSDIFSNLFYKEKKKVSTVKFIYIPSSTSKTNTLIPIFKLNPTEGKLYFNDELIEEINSKDKNFLKKDEGFYNINFYKLKEQQMDKFKPRDNSSNGFAFNIPLSVNLQLINTNNKIIIYEFVKLPQLGIIGFVNTKKEKLTFKLNPNTGELEKLTIEGKAVTTDQISSVNSGLNDIINISKSDSKITKLENEIKLIELENKKKELLREIDTE